ncbi:MAG: hypothetical protein ACPGVU_07270 [Limisphaerales bacterium]
MELAAVAGLIILAAPISASEIEFEQREDVLPSGDSPTTSDLETSDANWNAVIKSAETNT